MVVRVGDNDRSQSASAATAGDSPLWWKGTGVDRYSQVKLSAAPGRRPALRSAACVAAWFDSRCRNRSRSSGRPLTTWRPGALMTANSTPSVSSSLSAFVLGPAMAAIAVISAVESHRADMFLAAAVAVTPMTSASLTAAAAESAPPPAAAALSRPALCPVVRVAGCCSRSARPSACKAVRLARFVSTVPASSSGADSAERSSMSTCSLGASAQPVARMRGVVLKARASSRICSAHACSHGRPASTARSFIGHCGSIPENVRSAPSRVAARLCGRAGRVSWDWSSAVMDRLTIEGFLVRDSSYEANLMFEDCRSKRRRRPVAAASACR